jgi:hypothetical protein
LKKIFRTPEPDSFLDERGFVPNKEENPAAHFGWLAAMDERLDWKHHQWYAAMPCKDRTGINIMTAGMFPYT